MALSPTARTVGALFVVVFVLANTDPSDAFLTTFEKSSSENSTVSTGYPRCPREKFDCRNGKCITGSHWCDGIDHCGNNFDELSCRICLSGSIKCKASNQCVPSGARCNGQSECLDGSDESGCDTIYPAPTLAATTSTTVETLSSTSSSNLFSEEFASGASLPVFPVYLVSIVLFLPHLR